MSYFYEVLRSFAISFLSTRYVGISFNARGGGTIAQDPLKGGGDCKKLLKRVGFETSFFTSKAPF